MSPFDYAAHGYVVSDPMIEAQRAVWEKLARPGCWWTGAERVELARLVRSARRQRNDPPWLRDSTPVSSECLPDCAVEVVRRVALDVHSIDRDWARQVALELGDAAYVEICAVAVCVTAIDAFAEALGVPQEILPSPVMGDPDRVRPEGTTEAGAFVPMLDPFPGPNVSRALSLVPADNLAFHGLVGSMYAMDDFSELVWQGRPLSRPQVELVAARVSALNECFY